MPTPFTAGLLSLSALAATADKEEPAPNFSGLTVAHGPTSLREYRGEVVILSFWASWCPPCLKDLDTLATADDALRKEGIRVVAINVDRAHELSTVEKLVETRSWEFPVVLDSTQRALGSYFSTKSVPVSAVIDADGVLQELHLSWDDGDAEQLIEEARTLTAASQPPATTDEPTNSASPEAAAQPTTLAE